MKLLLLFSEVILENKFPSQKNILHLTNQLQKQMKNYLLISLMMLLGINAPAQKIETNKFLLEKKSTVEFNNNEWKVALKVRELPKPDQQADHQLREQVRDALVGKYPKRSNSSVNKSQAIPQPMLQRNFTGNTFNGYVPNDNDLAISNGDWVASVTNTTIMSKKLATNQTFGSYNLHSLTSSLGLPQEEFDPKIMYDPLANRFVFVCLNGFTDSTSSVLVGFSQSDSSTGAWNVYALPGDPLNLNLWTDFPMMALTEGELFLTVNLLYNDSTWQAGFVQTLIWQLNLSDGYNGLPLSNNLISGINLNGSIIRNLCPVKGGSQLYGPNMYFLSNRNFSAGNDTIFMVEVTDTIGSSTAQVNIGYTLSNLQYRMPPNADQPHVDKLQVNDARIMGAFIENGQIQFVNNSLDTLTGNGCIFTGLITNLAGSWICNAFNYADSNLDLCYPNISYAGSGTNDNRSLISLLQSSATVSPGTGAVNFDGINQFSPITTVKAGLGFIDMLNGTDRWGDYTGNQRKYNEPGKVWISGGYGIAIHQNRTWIGELSFDSTTSVTTIYNELIPTKAFPNPASDIVTIEFENSSNQLLTFLLHDSKGILVKKLYSGTLKKGGNEFSFSTQTLAKGNYTISIVGSISGRIGSKKIVKH